MHYQIHKTISQPFILYNFLYLLICIPSLLFYCSYHYLSSFSISSLLPPSPLTMYYFIYYFPFFIHNNIKRALINNLPILITSLPVPSITSLQLLSHPLSLCIF